MFTVPPGETWIVKTVNAYNTNVATSSVIFELYDPVAAVAGVFFSGTLAPQAVSNVQTWAAAMPGDQLLVYASLGPVHIWVSGARLPGV